MRKEVISKLLAEGVIDLTPEKVNKALDGCACKTKLQQGAATLIQNTDFCSDYYHQLALKLHDELTRESKRRREIDEEAFQYSEQVEFMKDALMEIEHIDPRDAGSEAPYIARCTLKKLEEAMNA